MKITTIIAAICILQPLTAALPPFFSSKREIEAILAAKELNDIVSSDDILQEIRKIPSGYLIITNQKIVPVFVHYMPTHKLGPQKFQLEFQKGVDIFQKNTFEN